MHARYIKSGAPAEIIYADILSNMLKHPDDIETFKVLFEKDKQLKEFCKGILSQGNKDNDETRRKVYESFFNKEITEIAQLKEQLEGIIKSTEKAKQQYIQAIEECKNAERTNPNKTQKSVTPETVSTESSNPTEMDKARSCIKMANTEELLINTVPSGMVNEENKGSIFDLSNEWFEIGEIEVEEPTPWYSIQQFLNLDLEGYKKFLEEDNPVEFNDYMEYVCRNSDDMKLLDSYMKLDNEWKKSMQHKTWENRFDYIRYKTQRALQGATYQNGIVIWSDDYEAKYNMYADRKTDNSKCN